MDWIEDIINHTLGNYKGRKIVLWGKYCASDKIKEKLQLKYNINNICYVDNNKSLIDDIEVFFDRYYQKKKERLIYSNSVSGT